MDPPALSSRGRLGGDRGRQLHEGAHGGAPASSPASSTDCAPRGGLAGRVDAAAAGGGGFTGRSPSRRRRPGLTQRNLQLVAVRSTSPAEPGLGESDLALAGGVNLILSPEVSVFLCKAKVMSPSGQCRAFDAAADGMVRGEGAGVVVLKRLADAVRDGDRVLAVIRGSAVNHDGASGGLTVPNPKAQAALYRRGARAPPASPRAASPTSRRTAPARASATDRALGEPRRRSTRPGRRRTTAR
jgi:hypothetical protein